MGYTNKTSHYELPQYVANDKPSWLGDFNAAMLKIDTVMADNDATAEAANSAATGAQTQVAALSSQLSTIQGQVNTAVDTATAADGKATTAQTVATQANTTAGEAKTLAETAKQSADLALPKSGGTMTGDLILNGAPTADNQAATKAYVDSHSGSELTLVKVNFDTTVPGNLSGTTDINARLYNNGLLCLPIGRTFNSTVSATGMYVYIGEVSGNPFNLTDNNAHICGYASLNAAMVTMFVIYDGNKTHLAVGTTPTKAQGNKIICTSTVLVE